MRSFGLRGVILALLAAITLAVFGRTVSFDFNAFDDQLYVTENPRVLEGFAPQSVVWAFTTFHSANWHPFTWLSLMLDATIGGADPRVYHLTNVILHVANVLFLFLVLDTMTRAPWRSAFVAALFAVHPLHVESVAWVAERKDVLSTLFWLLTMLAYTGYAARPGRGRLALVVLAFACGLMSKPMLVSLPLVLLLLDGWPLGRLAIAGLSTRTGGDGALSPWGGRHGQGAVGDARGPSAAGGSSAAGRHGNAGASANATGKKAREGDGDNGRGWTALLSEKAVLFALAAASCAITLIAQSRGGAVVTAIPLWARAANAAVSYVAYLGQMLWPSGLGVLYPHPGAGLPVWKVLLAILVLTGMSVLAIKTFRTRPYEAVGWLWYLVTLLPVIGLVQVGLQARADRYTYVPLIGPFIVVAWGAADLLRLAERRRSKSRGPGLHGGSTAEMVPSSPPLADASPAWHVDRALDRTVARSNAGHRAEPGPKWETGTAAARSVRDERRGHGVEPWRFLFAAAAATVVLALACAAYVQTGYWRDHLTLFRRLVEVQPGYATAHNTLGSALFTRGSFDEGLAHYREAVRLDPAYADAHGNLGVALEREGELDEALSHYREAIRLDPSYAEVRKNLVDALQGDGRRLLAERRIEAAIARFTEAVGADPGSAKCRVDLAGALLARGRTDDAIEQGVEAVRLSPQDATARANLGLALMQKGRLDEAATHLAEAAGIRPSDAVIHANLGLVLERQGRDAEAVAALERALGLDSAAKDAHFGLGLVLAKRGNLPAAMERFSEVLRLDPSDDRARRNLEILERSRHPRTKW